MNLVDFSLWLNGYPIRKAKEHLKFIQSIEDKTQYLEDRKWKMFNYHLQNTPFYKSLVSEEQCKDWGDVPIMTKRDLQVPLSQRLSNEFNVSNVYIDKTSGASGFPFSFAKDKYCHALTWAIIYNQFAQHNIDFGKSLQARFYGNPMNFKDKVKEKIKDYIGNRYRFFVFDLSEKALGNWLHTFQRKPFHYLNGYTSSIVQFAKFLRKRNVVLKKCCPTLKACIVTSETLFDDDKELMQKQFGIPVVNEYGASELDIIAFQNNQGVFQLNVETIYVEVVDTNGVNLKNGEEGRLIITSLFNKAHPFIRYDIGDIGSLSEDGRSIRNLVGRNDDVILLPSGKKAAGLTFYYITKSIIEDDGNVKEFVIEQFELNKFVVSYVSTTSILPQKIKFMKKEFETYLESGIDVNFERVEKINRSRSGKLKQFTSHL